MENKEHLFGRRKYGRISSKVPKMVRKPYI